MTWYWTWSAGLAGSLTWMFLAGLLTANPTTYGTPVSRAECSGPFESVGGRCLFVESLITGTWSHVREVCQDLGGDLVNLQDANFLSDIFQYLYATGQNDVSYWVGASDQVQEGRWVWADDNTRVHMNTPLWGDLSYPGGQQQPTGGLEENCAILRHDDAFYMHDTTCNDVHSLICEGSNGNVARASKLFLNDSSNSSSSNSSSTSACRPPYLALGGRCLFVDTVGTGTWTDKKSLCEELEGHMVKLDDANLLGAIYDYLMEQDVTDVVFWVGAFDEDHEGDWRWLDLSTVTLGTPFWGNFDLGVQEPGGGTAQNCAALNNKEHFLMHDYDCFTIGSINFGVICEF